MINQRPARSARRQPVDRSHSQFLIRSLIGLTLGVGGALAGCSSGQPTHHAVKARASSGDLTQFLMRDNEEPGFGAMASAATDSGVDDFAKNTDLTQAEAARLHRDGFVSITHQPIRGPRMVGVTNVQLFATASGARDWLAHEVRVSNVRKSMPGARIRRFTVTGLPGAAGWTASKTNEPPLGNVFWVQGRCLLVLGNQGRGSFARPLSTAAQAIYRRTNGRCP